MNPKSSFLVASILIISLSSHFMQAARPVAPARKAALTVHTAATHKRAAAIAESAQQKSEKVSATAAVAIAAATSSSIRPSLSTVEMRATRPAPTTDAYWLRMLMNNPLYLALQNNTEKIHSGSCEAENKILNDQSSTTEARRVALREHSKRVNVALEKLRKTKPVWCFTECVYSGCSLSRPYAPHRREAFEQEVVGGLQKQARVKKGHPIDYVAFASSSMFPHIRILIQALRAGVTNPLNIHLIDTSYKTYVESLRARGLTEAFSSELLEDLHTHVLNELPTLHKEKATIDIDGIHSVYKQHEIFSRCLALLRSTSSRTHYRIFVHSDVESYKNFCLAQSTHFADIVSAVDLGLDCSYPARLAHAQLNDFIFTYNKNAVSIYMPAQISLFFQDGKEVEMYKFSPQGVDTGFTRVPPLGDAPTPPAEGADAYDKREYAENLEYHNFKKLFFNPAYNPSTKTVTPLTKFRIFRYVAGMKYHMHRSLLLASTSAITLLASAWLLYNKCGKTE